MQRNDIGFATEAGPAERTGRAGRYCTELRFQAKHAHPERVRDAGQGAPDAAHADEAERLPFQLHAGERIPDSGPQGAIHFRNPARRAEHKRERMLGHAAVPIAADRADADAERLCRFDIDIAGRAGAEKDDAAQLRTGAQKRCVHRRVPVQHTGRSCQQVGQSRRIGIAEMHIQPIHGRPLIACQQSMHELGAVDVH